MSDIDLILAALPRVADACRNRVQVGEGPGPDLTDHQVKLLGHLDTVDPVMVTELAYHLGVTPSTMSLNLKRLREAGYVESERDPADRRVMNVRLTEAGSTARDLRGAFNPARVDALLREVAPEVREQVVRAVVVLADAADRLDGAR